jgi:hypothetical protein
MIPSYREMLVSSRHPKHEAGRTEARGRNRPFRLPTRGFPAVKLKFSSSPVPCVQLFSPSPLTPLKSILYSVLSQSVNPLHQCRRVLWSHPSLFHLQCVVLLFAPRVLFFAPSLFPFSPRTMTLASSAFHWPNHGDSLVFVCSAFRFHTKYIITFLASRARLRVGDVIKVRCHRNHHPGVSFLPPSHQHLHVEPLITPVIAPA